MKLILSLAFAFFISLPVSAHTARYRTAITADPATTLTIGWDQTSGQEPVVYYGPKDGGRDLSRYPTQKTPARIVS